jgi:hypothetical protein
MSHHGINVWGVGAAIIALLWGTLTEITQGPHKWPDTLLVYFASWVALNTLTGNLIRGIGRFLVLSQANDREISFRKLLEQIGVDSSALLFFVLEGLLLLGISIYLGIQGFGLLCGFALVYYGFMVAALLFSWILCHIHIPFPVQIASRPSALTRYFPIASYTFSYGIAVLSAMAIIDLWPRLAVNDIQLGAMLAGLTVLIGFSIRFSHPPSDLEHLKTLRTRIAFNLVETAAARLEVEAILLGPPRYTFLNAKADEAISVLDERTKNARSLVSRMNWLVGASERVHKAPMEPEVLAEIAAESRIVFTGIKKEIESSHAQLKRAAKLRNQLKSRLDLAKSLFDAPVEEIQRIMARVDAAGKESDEAMTCFHNCADRGLDAGKKLSEFLKANNIKATPSLSRSELVTTLFRP